MATQQVRATATITEPNFMGRKVWIHARPGDIGDIVHVDEEGRPTVRFERTGTCTVVDLGEEAVLAPVNGR